MAKVYSKEEIKHRIKQRNSEGKAFLVYGAGSGLSAKCAESGKADIIAVYSGAINRMRSVPTIVEEMGYCDCNCLMLEQSELILPIGKDMPYLAGVDAHDPLLNLEMNFNKLSTLYTWFRW